MLDLALILEAEGFDPREVLVMRHRPTERGLRKIFNWLAAEEPETFNWYQRTHGPRTESALSQARYLASFVGHEPGRALFVGLYAVNGSRMITRAECTMMPGYVRLMDLGMAAWNLEDARQDALLFELDLLPILTDRKGRLVIEWPKPDRACYRWADPQRNSFPVHAIREGSLLEAAMPPWETLTLTWKELKALPSNWRAALSQWRGVYFIFDRSDGKGYVGSACGSDNLLQRWLNYAASGHGGNALLPERRPENFHFSILQRMSPDAEADAVIASESGWKTRRRPYGLNAN